ncbi:hypothetical protein [Sphingobacterium olei]|nr:hypothetical protein [Sphingobacterium olei]
MKLNKPLLRARIVFTMLISFWCTVSHAQNLLDVNAWNIGSGSAGMFSLNGLPSENTREWGETPHGHRGVIWKSIPAGDAQADGGWNTTDITIDPSKMYRMTVWIKKSNSTSGRTYFGCRYVSNLDGVANGNPYFWNGVLPKLDQWYLLVGYIHAHTDASTVHLGGIYDGSTGQKVLPMTDFKFTASATSTVHRAYLYYDPNINDKQFFYAPRLEMVNGNEPSVESLLGVSSTQSSLAYFPGKVGIKTQTPREYDLAVNGPIRSKEIKVETANWPDYVFEEAYDLKTLTEIEQFIKSNGHLPELPKAKDAERDGISLGEMNKILLKKIEELILYMIENENKRVSLEEKLSALESLILQSQKK